MINNFTKSLYDLGTSNQFPIDLPFATLRIDNPSTLPWPRSVSLARDLEADEADLNGGHYYWHSTNSESGDGEKPNVNSHTPNGGHYYWRRTNSEAAETPNGGHYYWRFRPESVDAEVFDARSETPNGGHYYWRTRPESADPEMIDVRSETPNSGHYYWRTESESASGDMADVRSENPNGGHYYWRTGAEPADGEIVNVRSETPNGGHYYWRTGADSDNGGEDSNVNLEGRYWGPGIAFSDPLADKLAHLPVDPVSVANIEARDTDATPADTVQKCLSKSTPPPSTHH